MAGVQQMLMSQAGSSLRATISDQSLGSTSEAPASAYAYYELNSDGTVKAMQNGAVTTLETWRGVGASGSYESRVTMVSGTPTSGSVGVWEVLSTSRLWDVFRTGTLGEKSCTFTVEIRDAAMGIVLDTATVNLSAIVNDDL